MKKLLLFSLIAAPLSLVASEKNLTEVKAPEETKRTVASIKLEKRRNLALLCVKGMGVLGCTWALCNTLLGGWESVQAMVVNPAKLQGANADETAEKRAAAIAKKKKATGNTFNCLFIAPSLVYFGKLLAGQLKGHYAKAFQKNADVDEDEFAPEPKGA